MCTAVSFGSYFGRNLDIERSYGESVIITPRNYSFNMSTLPKKESHYAMIGMGVAVKGYPLYYEATNEKGLSMAGLNFPGNACYHGIYDNKDNVAPYELIPYILGECESVTEAQVLLERISLADISFSEELPLSPLHWIISDREKSITVEPLKDGLRVWDNPYGVLTNNPTFDWHLTNINNYMCLHEGIGENRLSESHSFSNYSLGIGAIGLPGDWSSASRFVRAVFIKEKSPCFQGERECVSHFFRILGAVAMPKGCVMTPGGEYEYTLYSCCCNAEKGIYYYTTYDNSSITAVNMHDFDLDGKEIWECGIRNAEFGIAGEFCQRITSQPAE